MANGSRLLFLGSGEFGLPTLTRLRERHELLAVITQPDRPAGRRRQLTPTPVAAWGDAHGLPVHRVENANDPAFVERVRELKPDAAVVIAFGQKLGEPLIAALGGLAVNLHGSLLPRHRGAAPVNWAVLSGDRETGVSVISLAQRMDAGLVYAQASITIDPPETAGELHDRLAALGPDAIDRVLADFATGALKGQPQDESRATRAPKLSKDDARVNFEATAEMVRRRVHGLTPWPGVTVTWRDAASGRERPLILRRVAAEPGIGIGAPPGTVLDGFRVATREGTVRLLEVQTPGGKSMTAEEFARGHPLSAGDTLVGGEKS